MLRKVRSFIELLVIWSACCVFFGVPATQVFPDMTNYWHVLGTIFLFVLTYILAVLVTEFLHRKRIIL